MVFSFFTACTHSLDTSIYVYLNPPSGSLPAVWLLAKIAHRAIY